MLFEKFNYELQKEFVDLFDYSDKLMKFQDQLLAFIESKNYKDNELSLYQIAILFNFYKSTNSLISILYLSNIGTLGDAKSIARKLIEIAITLKYISINRELNSMLYWQYSVNQASRTLNKSGFESLDINDKVEEIKKETKERLDEIKRKWKHLKAHNSSLDFNKKWSGKDLSVMADEANLSELYRKPYFLFNSSVHAGIEDIEYYFNDRKLIFDSTFEQKDVSLALLESFKAYLIILETVCESFNFLECSVELLSLNSKFEDLYSSYLFPSR